MPLTRQQKEQRVAEATQALSEATSYVFMAYDKLGVNDLEELRDKLHAEGGRVRVLPKRLLRLVAKNLSLDFDPTSITGQLAVAWAADATVPAKVLHDFAKTRAELVQLVAGAMEGDFLSQAQVIALAQLPSKDQLRGQLLSVLVGPARGLVTTLSGVQRNFLYALQAVADQKQ
jgi:large subunit ribosomal protein L10